MSDNKHFDQLVASGKPVGEVVAVDRFMVRIKGVQPIIMHALVMFEDGSKGYVQRIYEDHVIVLHLGDKFVTVGMMAVVQHDELVAKVGKDFIGRVISVTGEPLDDKGPIAAEAVRPVFADAVPFFERESLDTPLQTGLAVIDTMFPLMRGQRMAILGDGKSGKSTLATQMVLNQVGSDVISIYVLIAKRRSDVDTLLARLNSNNAIKQSIVIVSTVADSLILSHLAPYIACSMGEYLWQECDKDVMVIYDDLTSHAHIYREIALLSGMSPGRDSYPGDMFYVHSSLLERAGKLAKNHKTLTAIPLVFVPGDDITTFLPTNIMSITDGQWILNMDIFRDTMRPAVSVGLSVSRLGGRGQDARLKTLSGQVFKTLTEFAEAQEFARFGSEFSIESQQTLKKGGLIYKILNQAPGERFTPMAQSLMLQIALQVGTSQSLNVETLKKNVNQLAETVTDDAGYEKTLKTLQELSFLQSAEPKTEVEAKK